MTRALSWDGCWNVRDLGGLPTAHGLLRRGQLIRSSGLQTLTPDGWRALRADGVRLIIDLRTAWELAREPYAVPHPDLQRLHLPLEEGLGEDPEFRRWQTTDWLGTPLYYAPYLARFADRAARVLRAIATHDGGGVLFHCSAGWDRTGMISAMLLTLLGAPFDAIRADYLLSHACSITPAAKKLGIEDRSDRVEAVMRSAGETLEGALQSFTEAVRAASPWLSPEELLVFRDRVITPNP